MRPKIFIGSSREASGVAEAVQRSLRHDGEAELWSQGLFKSINVAIEDLMKAVNVYDFAVFVLFPEDLIKIRGKDTTGVRDNVIFELGLFLGKLGRERVFFISPEEKPGGTVKLRLPSDLSGITPSTYDPAATRLEASVSTALYEFKQTVRDLAKRGTDRATIYDGTDRIIPYHFIHRGGHMWRDGKIASPCGEGSLRFREEGVVELERTNSEGRYEIELREKGKTAPSIPRKHQPVNRVFKISFEAKVNSGEHKIRLVMKDLATDKWLDNECILVKSDEWQDNEIYLRTPTTADLLFRIDDEEPSVLPSVLSIRRLAIFEEA